jgi:hypothetical protein
METSSCIVVILALLTASMVMQWMRARSRQKLVRSADPALLVLEDQAKWQSIDGGFDFVFKDFRKLQVIKRNLANYSGEFGSRYQRYCKVSRLEMAVTATMLVFCATAFLFCN